MKLNKKLLDELGYAEEAGHVALTRHLCEMVLAEHPNHATTLVRYASCLTDLSLYDRALIVLEQAERVAPLELRHLVIAQRGHLQMAKGDHEIAERYFMSAHELDPDDATYLIYAGTAAFAQGYIQRAEELARKASKCSVGCIDEAYFNLGGYLLAQKKFEEAEKCYIRALEIDPSYGIAQKRLDDLQRLREFQCKDSNSMDDKKSNILS